MESCAKNAKCAGDHYYNRTRRSSVTWFGISGQARDPTFFRFQRIQGRMGDTPNQGQANAPSAQVLVIPKPRRLQFKCNPNPSRVSTVGVYSPGTWV